MVEVDAEAFEQQPGETFQAWRLRLHDQPTWLREKAEGLRGQHPHRARYLLERASLIEAGGAVQRWSLADETGIRAR